MKTKNKALLLSLCAVLLVAASVFGTLAYLTSSDSVVNTFTVGNVQIKLDEAKVGDDGKKTTPEERTETTVTDNGKTYGGNSYHLLPGHSYDKDPTVTVKGGSEDAYVRLLVTVTFEKELAKDLLNTDLSDIFTGYNKSNWARVSYNAGTATVDSKTVTQISYEYRYVGTENHIVASSSTDTKLPALFTGVKVPDAWGNDELAAVGNFTISIVGQAIQADGFTATDDGKTAEDNAWAAFN